MKLAAAFLAGSVCGLWVWSRIVLRVESQFIDHRNAEHGQAWATYQPSTDW